ncbi:E3 ubiquitin-protein ligase RNF8-like [Pyrus ussuriensis x Pyrus communis]|uniref:RING-type E3 ubiquitin transferase n=1 Tax=Pyrus ussuriensis x Pyrus communis TaxID=2448454 RepID=A0A5N5HCJ5_9ROSA|nr:E3 ubiquitin-protein ligase RNF8-like [Pyrus ussuriensis x Pyrus communis]
MEAVSGDYRSSQSRRKPASKAIVEALDAFIKTDGVNYGTDIEFCVVCLEKVLSGEQVTPLPCSHMFHAQCVVEWFKSGHPCLVCRFECPTD